MDMVEYAGTLTLTDALAFVFPYFVIGFIQLDELVEFN